MKQVRQAKIPVIAAFQQDKKVNDLVYAFIRCSSTVITGKIICYKSDCTYERFCEYLDNLNKPVPMCERTFRATIKLCRKVGLLIEGRIEGEKVFYLEECPNYYYQDVDEAVLEKLLSAGVPNLIKLYSFLQTSRTARRSVNRGEMLRGIGYSTNPRNYAMIDRLLEQLVELKLRGVKSEVKLGAPRR